MKNLKLLRTQRGISQKDMGKIFHATQNTVSQWESGVRKPSYDVIQDIANYFKVSTDYLLGDEVDSDEVRYAREKTKELHEQHPEISVQDIENKTGVGYATFRTWYQGYGDYFNDKLYIIADLFNVSLDYLIGKRKIKDIERYNPVVHKIPVLGHIAAGVPIYADEHIEDYTYTEHNGGSKYFALRVKGDSMNAAKINDGDLLIVREQPTVENGEMAIVRVNNDDATVKYFRQEGDVVQLIPRSYNPEHQIQFYDLKKDKIDIVGKVVECRTIF